MDPLDPIIQSLHAEGRLRVWSLVITIFGDAVQPRGGRVSTSRLQRLLGRLGVESGALRTALSRLGRDGWVTSERAGRTSVYRLTHTGLADFSDASQRIYAPPRTGPVDRWSISLGTTPGGIAIAGMSLRPADTASPKADFELLGTLTQLSAHLRETLVSTPHRNALEVLLGDLEALAHGQLDPLDAAAARILLIHRWRRLVLRYPEIPPQLLPAELAHHEPRALVASAYNTLRHASEAWWDSGESDMPAMPAALPYFAQRFQPTTTPLQNT
jgi:phenylacetic acid degradation operon negative regulatory protein